MHLFFFLKKVTSGRVSPSELPDSPCQSPPSARKSAAPSRPSLQPQPPPISFPKAPTTSNAFTMKAATSAAKAPAMTGTTTAHCTTTADLRSSEVADEEAEAIDHTNEEDLDNVDDDQEGFEEEDNNVKRYNDEGTTPAVNSERNSFVSSDDLSLSEDDTKVKFNGLLNKGVYSFEKYGTTI